jgi:two-component system, sensor histidine kinase and response regulator
MDKKHTLLIVDDKSENLQYLNNILQADYNVRATLDGYMALEFIKTNTPDLILLDIKMPKIDGYSVCNELKKYPHLEEIPIIFISALDDVEHKVKAFNEGGVDYITKPFEPKEVLARVKTQLEIAQSKKMISELLHQQDIFMKKIMHEINTPLSVISLNSDSIERQKGSMEEINSIKASTKTLQSIYLDLSYLIKKESPTYIQKDIDLVKFLSSRIMFFDELATVKNIDISLEIDHSFDIIINEYEFERVVDNTLSNAIKYSNENATIIIQTTMQDDRYLLKIIDNGVGIEKVDSIFTPYFQQSDENLGFGLGLTIVKEICDKHNILIRVESEKDKGSCFIYDLSSIIKDKL